MRPYICDFCGDYIPDDEVIEVETCKINESKGHSWQVCESCEYGMVAQANGIKIDLLAKEEADDTNREAHSSS